MPANTEFSMLATNRQLEYPAWKIINRQSSVDTHFQDSTGSVLLWFLPLKVAYTSFMDVGHHSPVRLHMMHGLKFSSSIVVHVQDVIGSLSILF